MDNYIAVVFATDVQAFDGLQALWTLNRKGNITVRGAAVIRRDLGGKIEVEKKQTLPGLRTVLGATVGFLLGNLAGPAGAAAGAYAGAVGGLGADVVKSGEHDEAAGELERILRPGQSAIVAEVAEDETSLIDPTMRRLDGVVFRRSKNEIRGKFFDLDDVERERVEQSQNGYFADPSA